MAIEISAKLLARADNVTERSCCLLRCMSSAAMSAHEAPTRAAWKPAATRSNERPLRRKPASTRRPNKPGIFCALPPRDDPSTASRRDWIISKT